MSSPFSYEEPVMHCNGKRCSLVPIVLLCLAFSDGVSIAVLDSGEQLAQELIQRAGNSDHEGTRLKYLKQLLESPTGEDTDLKKDAAALIECIERWNNNPYMPYFRPAKEFRIDISESSPLYPLLCFYRGRQLVQHTIGAGGTWGGGWESVDTARALFRIAADAFPENRIIRMYLGEPVPAEKQYPPNPRAPEWANLQRECLERLADVMEWWIDNRQRPDGSFGGGWGDDVELWRVWYSVIIPFQDDKLVNAQARLARGVWSQPHMSKGYTSKMSDVEHTAEDSADTLSPMLLLEPDEPEWSERTLRIVELMRQLWMSRNDRGLLQFKSIYFNVDEIQDRETCDTFYHTRVAHPVMILWLRTADTRVGELISDWMSTWVDAAQRAENGKPAGVLPCAIHWPSGRIGGPRPDWWNPINYTDNETNYYTFPSQLSQMCKCLLLTYYMTGEDKFVGPLRSMARIRQAYITGPVTQYKVAPGSEAWCAKRTGGILPALAKYRMLTADDQFNSLLLQGADPIITHRLTGDMSAIVKALRNNVEFLRVNFQAYTSELRYTDRLFAYSIVYGPWGPDEETRNAGVRHFDRSIIYQVATGDPGDLLYFPMMAVRWLTPPREIAAFVVDSGTDRFKAQLFHFGTEPRPMGAEFYTLEPGTYDMVLSCGDLVDANCVDRTEVMAKGARTRVTFQLAAQTMYELSLMRRPRGCKLARPNN